jgi:hypothetical protein
MIQTAKQAERADLAAYPYPVSMLPTYNRLNNNNSTERISKKESFQNFLDLFFSEEFDEEEVL